MNQSLLNFIHIIYSINLKSMDHLACLVSSKSFLVMTVYYYSLQWAFLEVQGHYLLHPEPHALCCKAAFTVLTLFGLQVALEAAHPFGHLPLNHYQSLLIHLLNCPSS